MTSTASVWNLTMHLFLKRGITPTAVATEGYHCYRLLTDLYPVYFC